MYFPEKEKDNVFGKLELSGDARSKPLLHHKRLYTILNEHAYSAMYQAEGACSDSEPR